MAEALEEYPNVEIIPLEGVGHDIKPFMYEIGPGQDSLSWMAEQVRDENGHMPVVVAIIVVVVVAVVAAIWMIKRRKASNKNKCEED